MPGLLSLFSEPCCSVVKLRAPLHHRAQGSHQALGPGPALGAVQPPVQADVDHRLHVHLKTRAGRRQFRRFLYAVRSASALGSAAEGGVGFRRSSILQEKILLRGIR